jgi:hypothetical protein
MLRNCDKEEGDRDVKVGRLGVMMRKRRKKE